MDCRINIIRLEGVTPGQTYSVKWKKKNPPMGGQSADIVANAEGTVTFKYTFHLRLLDAPQPQQKEEAIHDVSVTIKEVTGGDDKPKTVFGLGLLLHNFLNKGHPPPVMVRTKEKMKLYFSVHCKLTGGGDSESESGNLVTGDGASSFASSPQHSTRPHPTASLIPPLPPTQPPIVAQQPQPQQPPRHVQDRIDVLKKEIEQTELQLANLESEIKETREKLIDAKQESLVTAVKSQKNLLLSSANSSGALLNGTAGGKQGALGKSLLALKKKMDLQDLKDASLALQLEITSVREETRIKALSTEKAKQTCSQLDMEIPKIGDRIKEKKMQHSINESALEHCLVIRKEQELHNTGGAGCTIS
eukprot:PhF_6_TR29294/c0_g1_i2/m.42937